MGRINHLIQSHVPSGSFAHSVATLMTGTTFAQALLILVAPLLTRLYTPEDFGILALYTSGLSIIAVMACWSYDYAIVLPEKDDEAANLLVLCMIICLGMATLVAILVSLFRNPVAALLSAPQLAPWLWLMPISIIEAGFFKAFNYWSTRSSLFKLLSARQITQSSLTSLAQLSCGATLHLGSGGLIIGSVIGQVAATARLVWQIVNTRDKSFLTYASWKGLKNTAIRYKRFPLYDSWSGMFNTASSMLPALLLGYFFSPAIVGYYALGNRVLATPMGVIGGAVGQVFYPQATRAKLNGDLDKLTFNMFNRLTNICFVPILLLVIVAPDLFSIIFGDQWRPAGQYLRWMSLWLFFQFISSPLSTIYYVLERQRDLLVFSICIFLSRLLVIILGGISGDVLLTIALFGITGALFYMLLTVHILHLAKVIKVYKTIYKRLLEGLAYSILPLLAWYISYNTLFFVSMGIASGIVFLIILAYQIKANII